MLTWRGPSADLCAARAWYSAQWTPATMVSPDSPVCLLPALRPRNSPSSQLGSLPVSPSLGSLSYATWCQVSENHCFVYFVLSFVWAMGRGYKFSSCYSLWAQSRSPTAYYILLKILFKLCFLTICCRLI